MINKIKNYLLKLSADGIALAFSGGVDSSLLLAILSQLNKEKPFNLAALTMHTILQNDDEIQEAIEFAKKYGVKQEIFTFNPFSLEEVKNNHIDRCYWCKKAIFQHFVDYAKQNNIKYIIDGTNFDDLKEYRPGRKALKELGIISPLAELKITKSQIRQISAELGLSTASKPSVPCLATRFEYNTLLDDKKIKMVYNGEKFIKSIFPEIKNLRLRVHNNLARIEISKEFIPEFSKKYDIVSNELKKLGFDYITLDLEGFRSGSHDIHVK